MSILDHQDYRSYLKALIAERARVNPRYSLRSMARKLGVAPSFLSSILKGQRNLSSERALAIAALLKLNATEQEYFHLLVQAATQENPTAKESCLKRMQALNPRTEFQDLSLDHFKVISDWFHFGILACTDLDEIDLDKPEIFARLLDIHPTEVELALARLERLEMIERDAKGHYRKTRGNPRVVSQSPNQALRNFHRQTLQKATESLESQSPQEKVVGSETFAIDREQLSEFRALTDRFFEEALALAKRAKKKNEVYHLGVNFFRLTQNSSRRFK